MDNKLILLGLGGLAALFFLTRNSAATSTPALGLVEAPEATYTIQPVVQNDYLAHLDADRALETQAWNYSQMWYDRIKMHPDVIPVASWLTPTMALGGFPTWFTDRYGYRQGYG